MAGTFTFPGLEQLWESAGGSPDWAETMASIAEVESGGNPSARNASGATGIWQELDHGTTTEEENPGWSTLWAVNQLGSGAGISAWGQGTGDPVGTASQAAGDVPLPAATLQSLLGQAGVKTSVVPLTAQQQATAQSPASQQQIQDLAQLATSGGNFNPLGGAGVSGIVTNTTGAVANKAKSAVASNLGDVGTYILKGILTLAFAGVGVYGVTLLTGRGKGPSGAAGGGGITGVVAGPAEEASAELPPFPEEAAEVA